MAMRPKEEPKSLSKQLRILLECDALVVGEEDNKRTFSAIDVLVVNVNCRATAACSSRFYDVALRLGSNISGIHTG